MLFIAVAVVFALASGGDDGDANPGVGGTPGLRTPSTGGTRGGPQPVLSGPASKFAASQEDIGDGIQGVPNESASLTPATFADPTLGPFRTIDEGRQKLAEWGYQEGYLGVLQPDGLLAGVVQGRFYVRVETHLFASIEGATAAFDWYDQIYSGIDALEPEQAAPLANESASWKSLEGKVENTDLDRAYHRFVFRRGNLVAIVQTVGADTFMTIDPARDIAVIVDERALGNRAAPTPTPSGGTLPPTPVPTR
ncbi:MAG: hypothetical protein WD557_15150 [Dehalococcoidia bacterium]